MAFFKDITKKVTETAKVAAKKSSGLVETTKLNMNISSEEDKIQKIFSKIGQMIFDDFERGEEIQEEFKDHCRKVLEIKENINNMKGQIMRLKNTKICPSCGAELEQEVSFCPKCGAKQEMKLIFKEVDSDKDDSDVNF